MKHFIHKNALVETQSIGKDTQIWAFTHVLKGAKIGNNVNIGDHCFVEGEVDVGSNVTIKNGVSLWDGITVEDDVFIGPNAAFTNDNFPRSKNTSYKKLSTLLKKGCSIGANATILPGITVGEYAMVGAGSIVTKNLAPFTLVYGNPATYQGFICICGEKLNFGKQQATCKCGREYEKKNETVMLL